MKIARIEAYPLWGGHRKFLFTVVDTHAGISGVGEAGPSGREPVANRCTRTGNTPTRPNR